MKKNENWMGNNKKAVMLVRVSSKGQEHNNSHTYQSEDGKEYALEKGLDLVEIVPIVESAKQSDERVQYHAAIKRALKNGIRHIMFDKFDRESRNLTDNEKNEALVLSDKIVIHYVQDKIILHKNSPTNDFFMRDIQAAQSKHFIRDHKIKTARGMLAKAESGWSPIAKPPLGYINEKLRTNKGFEKGRGSIIVPDPIGVNVRIPVREFEIRGSDPTPSLKSVRDQIILEGLIPFDQIKNYPISSIERRLKNIFYDGRFIWDGVEYVGKHERIIPKELFNKVQRTFGIKSQYGKKTDGLFQNGWLKCADPKCGCRIIFDPREKLIKSTGKVKTYRHYRCTNGKKIHTTTKGMRITEEALMDQLSRAVEEISISEDFRDELIEALNQSQEKARRAIKQDIHNYELGLKSLEGEEDVLYRDLKKNILDEATYHRQIAFVRSERSRFTGLLKTAQLHINDVAGETVQSILQLATNAKLLWKNRSAEERRDFLDKLLSNRMLDGTSVRYQIIKPLTTLSEMKENSNWRRERDLNPR